MYYLRLFLYYCIILLCISGCTSSINEAEFISSAGANEIQDLLEPQSSVTEEIVEGIPHVYESPDNEEMPHSESKSVALSSKGTVAILTASSSAETGIENIEIVNTNLDSTLTHQIETSNHRIAIHETETQSHNDLFGAQSFQNETLDILMEEQISSSVLKDALAQEASQSIGLNHDNSNKGIFDTLFSVREKRMMAIANVFQAIKNIMVSTVISNDAILNYFHDRSIIAIASTALLATIAIFLYRDFI